MTFWICARVAPLPSTVLMMIGKIAPSAEMCAAVIGSILVGSLDSPSQVSSAEAERFSIVIRGRGVEHAGVDVRRRRPPRPRLAGRTGADTRRDEGARRRPRARLADLAARRSGRSRRAEAGRVRRRHPRRLALRRRRPGERGDAAAAERDRKHHRLGAEHSTETRDGVVDVVERVAAGSHGAGSKRRCRRSGSSGRSSGSSPTRSVRPPSAPSRCATSRSTTTTSG